MKAAKPERGTVTTTLRIPPELYEALREAAFRLRRSQNEIVAEALKEKLEKLGFLKAGPGGDGGMA